MLIFKSDKPLKFESNDTAINNLIKPRSSLQVKFKEVYVTEDKIVICFIYDQLFCGSENYTFAVYINRNSMISFSRDIDDMSISMEYTLEGCNFIFKIYEEEDHLVNMFTSKDSE